MYIFFGGVLCRAPCSVSPVGHGKDEDERDAIIRQLRAELRAERRRSQLMIDEVEQVVADQIREQVCPAHAPPHLRQVCCCCCCRAAAAASVAVVVVVVVVGILIVGYKPHIHE